MGTTGKQAPPLVVMTAGSMTGPVQALARAAARTNDVQAHVIVGPSGNLRHRIEAGEPCDVFVSASLAHPRRLARAGKAGPIGTVATTGLAALCHTRLNASPSHLLDMMLNPEVRLATSTPRLDPCGDYTWAMFRLAQTVRPGSFAALSRKALRLTGGPDALKPPKKASVYPWAIEQDHADIFLTYLPTATRSAERSPMLEMVRLPPALSVRAEMGVCVTGQEKRAAWQFAYLLLSQEGRRMFAKWGFDPPEAG